MDERVIKFRVGVMVLATFIIGAILVVLFSGQHSLLQSTYTIYIHFPRAPGVTPDTPVRKDGILIGRVSDVHFAEDDPRFEGKTGVVITARINSKVKLHATDVPVIRSSSVLGDAVLEFVPDDSPPGRKNPRGKVAPASWNATQADQPPPDSASQPDVFQPKGPQESIPPGSILEGRVEGNPLDVLTNLQGNLARAIDSVSDAGNQVSILAKNLNQFMGDNEQIGRIVNKTERTLDLFQKSLVDIDSVLGDEQTRTRLKQSVEELPNFLRDTRDAIGGIQKMVAQADRNLQNLEGFTGPLGERGGELVRKVDQTVGRLDELLEQFVRFGQALNRPEGSFGQFVKNPDLYQHLNSAARNIDELTRDLKPIVADARALSDKLARHPEILGVRGALQKPSSGIK